MNDLPSCEMCGENPVRRSDYEYRQANPEDPWMMLCSKCDDATGGSRPARNGGKGKGSNDGRKCAKLRLEYYVQELEVDRAVAARDFAPKKMPKEFVWMNDLTDAQVKEIKTELFALKMLSAQFIFSPYEYEVLEANLRKMKSICGTYQLMSSLKVSTASGTGTFTLPALPKPDEETVQNEDR